MRAPGKLPPLAALRTFEAAARHLNFTRAAAELHVTHSAISHQIRSLEALLGFDLFLRGGGRLRLTPAGTALLVAANEALCQLADTLAGLRRASRSDRLCVSVLPSFGSRWLGPRIGRFIEAHPGCEIAVQSTALRADLLHDGVDVAVRWGFGHYPGLNAEHLLDEVLFPVAAPALLTARGSPTTPEAIRGWPLLRSRGEDWLPWFRAAGLDWPEPDGGIVFDDSALAIQAAIDGHGVLLARASLAHDALRMGQLRRLFDTAVALRYHGGQDVDAALGLDSAGQARRWCYWIVTPGHRPLSPLARAFIDWLRSEVGAMSHPL